VKEVVMKSIVRLFAAGMSLLFIPAVAPAQVENDAEAPADDVPAYQIDAISFAALNSPLSRLDVFAQVSYEDLSFVKNDDRYTASYEMMVSLYDSTDQLVNEKLWTEDVKAATFDESVSSQAYSLTQRVFEIPPGIYKIVSVLRDMESRVSRKLVRQIDVQDYAHAAFALSDIMLVKRINAVGERKSIVPNVSPNVGNLSDGFFLFFEAYNDLREDSVRFTASVMNEKGEKALTRDTTAFIAKGRNQVFFKIDHSSLTLGDYRVVVQAAPLTPWSADSVRTLPTTNRKFVIRWRGLPRGVGDLDLAIDQLQYLAKDKELDHIKEATTVEEKQKRFLEFWKTKDPNPSTPRNEKMEDYYARVEYANKHFKHYVDGWRTDMGMVYIRFGTPSNIDRHPFDIDSKPYEVWAYYELNFQFVFVDESGFGEYRLVTPLWDVWQRAKD
jgi:GWxTD domain-containing protein